MARVTEELLVVENTWSDSKSDPQFIDLPKLPNADEDAVNVRALMRLLDKQSGFVKCWHSEGKEIVRR